MSISKLTRRFWAYYFDNIIVAGIYSGVLLVFKYILDMNIPIDRLLQRDATVWMAFYLTYGLLFIIYEVFFLSLKISATPGKMMLGLEIVSDNGGGFLKAFLRSVLKVIATLTILLPFIFFLLAAFSEKKQTIHDRIAGTFVVRKNVSHSGSKEINTEELFEEMKRRGYRTYSEQKALVEELYGGGKKTSSASYAWLGVLFFIVAISCGAFFSMDSYTVLEDYILKQTATNIRYRENGVQVDKDIADKYLGMWVSNDRQFGFTVYYEDETGTMYINSSQRAFEFRFDSDNTLFVTDGNNNEFEVGYSIYGDAIYMTRPVSEQLEYKISLNRVN